MTRTSTPGLRILGVDPGTWNTGWGFIGGTERDPAPVEFGCIRLAREGSLDRRLARIEIVLAEVISRLRPLAAAVEAPFHGVNPRAALQLAHARGVVLAVLARSGIEVGEYSPATVKKSVTGNGRAAKGQVQFMVTRLLGLAGTAPDPDAADALAVALCHAVTACSRVAVARAQQCGVLAARRTGTGRRA